MPTPRRARPNAFDVTRTDRDEAEPRPVALTDLLPRVEPVSTSPASSPALQPRPSAEESHAAGGGVAGRAGRPRGAGGRAGASSRITATAARVPVELYEAAENLVKGPGRPSWGQLIAWTCDTDTAQVTARVLENLAPVGALTPRGQNKRARGSAQVTARFTPAEHERFITALEATRAAAQRADLDSPVTATAVVIAALQVAARM